MFSFCKYGMSHDVGFCIQLGKDAFRVHTLSYSRNSFCCILCRLTPTGLNLCMTWTLYGDPRVMSTRLPHVAAACDWLVAEEADDKHRTL